MRWFKKREKVVVLCKGGLVSLYQRNTSFEISLKKRNVNIEIKENCFYDDV